MVFCNEKQEKDGYEPKMGHNPYFNRWFSAMPVKVFEMDKEELSQSLF